MTPQRFDEWVFGTAKQFSAAWSGRAYFQYRKGTHYWEDTPNMSRILYNEGNTTVPGTNASIPQQPYIANLAAMMPPLGIRSNPRQRLRHRGSRRLVHRLPRALTARGGISQGTGLGQGLVHLQPLLRQLRPGRVVNGRVE